MLAYPDCLLHQQLSYHRKNHHTKLTNLNKLALVQRLQKAERRWLEASPGGWAERGKSSQQARPKGIKEEKGRKGETQQRERDSLDKCCRRRRR